MLKYFQKYEKESCNHPKANAASSFTKVNAPNT